MDNKKGIEKLIDKISVGIFYFMGVMVTLPRCLANPIVSDRLSEFIKYEGYLTNGFHLSSGINELLDTALLTTVVPAYLQRWFNLVNPELFFRALPCFFFALVPVLTYLTARRWLSVEVSIMAGLFILAHYYFNIDPYLGRVVAGWGFLSCLIYALASGNLLLAGGMLAVLLFTHYGSFIIGLLLMAAVGIASHIKGQGSLSLLLTAFIISAGAAWYLYFNGLGYIFRAELLPTYAEREYVSYSFLWLDTVNMNPVGIALLTIIWGIFITMTAGIVLNWQKCPLELKTLGICSVAGIIVGLAVPQVSYLYGFSRVVFSTLPVLSGFFMSVLGRVIPRGGTKLYLLAAPFIVLHPMFSPF